jgi:hypothetical protein
VKTEFGKTIPDANPKKIFVRLEESGLLSRALDPSPLETRGWTLQKCIFPRRIIHYTAEEPIWECNTRHFCECGHVEGLTVNGTMPMVRTEIARGKGNDKVKDLAIDGWMHLAQSYLERNLTFLSDKVAAVSGLAQMVQASIPATEDSTYLAGLFLRSLPRHLLWTVKERRSSAHRPVITPDAPARPVPPRAPTWSWASVDNHVSYPRMLIDDRDQEYITVHREGCFATASLQGPKTTVGELLVEGPVIPVKLITVERAKVVCDVARDFDVKADKDGGHDCWTCRICTLWHRCEECNLKYAPRDTECLALKVGMYCVPSDRQRASFSSWDPLALLKGRERDLGLILSGCITRILRQSGSCLIRLRFKKSGSFRYLTYLGT